LTRPRRLFFALVPGRVVRQAVERVQQSAGNCGRAARPGQFHVTLAFLGMQKPELIPKILGIACQLSFEPCQVVLDQIGRFKRAGVLWLGSNQVPDELLDFQHSLVGALLDAGIGYDRKPWKFHVTLYRKMRKYPAIMDPVAIEWPLNGFELIESVSVGSGVEYHSIGHWNAHS